MPVLQDPDRRYGLNRPPQRPLELSQQHDLPHFSDLSSPFDHQREPQREEPFSIVNDRPVTETSCRQELIRCIKRGEHPTWIPVRSAERDSDMDSGHNNGLSGTGTFRELLPPLEINKAKEDAKTELAHPSEIERPRSALHSGDFREPSPERSFGFQSRRSPLEDQTGRSSQGPLASSPTTPWYIPNATPRFRRTDTEPLFEERARTNNIMRSRAPSLGSSLSNSFVYRPPTSPLVHAASNTDIDFLPQSKNFPSSERSNRRRTLPPESLQSMQRSSPDSRPTNFSRPLPNLRRENSLPYQAHQPRRSLTSNSLQDGSSPITPPRGSRRPSFSSEYSPLQHASMVGSYEESILRGRMSTTPSKPLNFVAQIGVLGKGDCKPSLRCPAHVTVPFPAVFYSYGSGPGRPAHSDDSPSPYVGNIDLEHNLKPVVLKAHRRQLQEDQSPGAMSPTSRDITAPENTPIGRELDRRKREKRRRRSLSPKAPNGGCYRIPQQGQLQIIIKNPNKTAVKLFLVPYDLEGMEPGTKTFIRQRSYSGGPILDAPISSTGNAAPAGFEKSTLRYLIHLRICCPSRGRFYLYDNVRVVFANRVPDGKEKLRNEIQLPEPRYSTWKANKESTSVGSAGAKLAADKAFRRRSSGFGVTPFGFGDIDGLASFETPSYQMQQEPQPMVPPIPNTYNVPSPHQMSAQVPAQSEPSKQQLILYNSRPSSSRASTPSQAPPPVSGFNIGSPVNPTHEFASGSDSGESGASGPYTKLRRQEGRYGSSERFHGLLTQRLKGMEVQRTLSNEDDGKNGKEDADGADEDGDVAMSGA